MDGNIELILRAFGIFLSVYFTIGWGEKNKIKHDMPILVLAMVAALIVRFYD